MISKKREKHATNVTSKNQYVTMLSLMLNHEKDGWNRCSIGIRNMRKLFYHWHIHSKSRHTLQCYFNIRKHLNPFPLLCAHIYWNNIIIKAKKILKMKQPNKNINYTCIQRRFFFFLKNTYMLIASGFEFCSLARGWIYYGYRSMHDALKNHKYISFKFWGVLSKTLPNVLRWWSLLMANYHLLLTSFTR